MSMQQVDSCYCIFPRKVDLDKLIMLGQVSERAVAERLKSNRNQTSISLKYCQCNLD